jgi:heterodisulfide reductase subunit C
MSRRKGIEPSLKNIPIFHTAFLSSIRRHGRIHEVEMATEYTLRSGGLKALLKQVGLGMTMFAKGKIKLLPAKLRHTREVKDIFRKTEGKR